MAQNFIESSEDEIPEVDLTLRIQPYMFEPLKKNEQTCSSDGPSSSDGSNSSESDEENERLLNTHWCLCGHCGLMSTVSESRCCKEMNDVCNKMDDANVQCITLHEGFEPNCLNLHVLEVSFYEFLQENGPLENQQPHEAYRYIAYRRFARWIWRVLGKKNRRILPSCVISKIRETFPSEHYCGFKYPV